MALLCAVVGPAKGVYQITVVVDQLDQHLVSLPSRDGPLECLRSTGASLGSIVLCVPQGGIKVRLEIRAR
jgi:hypothetical protein